MIKFDPYPDYIEGEDGTKWQFDDGRVAITVGKGANVQNPYPDNNDFWWVYIEDENEKLIEYEDGFSNEKDAVEYANKFYDEMNKDVEVTDFGFNMETKEMDGFIKCPCGRELHFRIKQKKLQDIVDMYKEMR